MYEIFFLPFIPEHAALADLAVMRPGRLGLTALLAVPDFPALQQQLHQLKHYPPWLCASMIPAAGSPSGSA